MRLALTTNGPDCEDAYLPQFLFHLSDPENPVQHFSLFTPGQREAVLSLLHHIRDRHRETVALYADEDDLETTLRQWEGFVSGGDTNVCWPVTFRYPQWCGYYLKARGPVTAAEPPDSLTRRCTGQTLPLGQLSQVECRVPPVR